MTIIFDVFLMNCHNILTIYRHPPLFGTPPPFGKFHDFKGTAEPLASDSLATGFILL